MEEIETEVATGQPKKRTFKKFSFRGVDLDALLDMSTDELVKLFTARARRRFQRDLKRKPMALIKKLRKAALSVEILAFLLNVKATSEGGNDFEINDSERTVGHTVRND
ncbi:unnamed protein product [Camellia sinensis]